MTVSSVASRTAPHFERRLISGRFGPRRKPYYALNRLQEAARQAVLHKIDDGQYEFEARSCALCGGDEFLVLAERDRYSIPVQTVICPRCSLLATNPVMRVADYADFYRNHYTALYEGFQYSPEEFFENQRAAGKRLYEGVAPHLKLQGKVVAEVGCAAGGILSYLQPHCAKVVGCDFGTAFLEHGIQRGLELKVGGVSDLTSSKPDVIIYSHVLEHVRDIGVELANARAVLPQDGVLVIDVPGVYNIEKAYGADYLTYLQNAHLFQFTARTLSAMMARHGFETVSVDERCIGVFRKSDGAFREPAADSREHARVIDFLERIEKRYRYYKLAAWPRKTLVKTLKVLGLHAAVRSSYRKIVD